jgi:tetratricopeptide (TPR) repeat protein
VNFRDGKLLGVTGKVQYEIIGTHSVSTAAAELHQQGRGAGGHGDYKTAITLFEQASELSPAWPHPYYDKAYTYLLVDDFDAARTCYLKTLELSPRGFFTAITALHTLKREQQGDLPRGTYLRYLSLEWIADEVQKEPAVRKLIDQIPQFAPAWKEFALFCDDDDRRLAAIERGLAADPDAETKGMLEINRALIFNLKGDRSAAVQSLGELALNPESTLGTEHSAKAALSILLMTPKSP